MLTTAFEAWYTLPMSTGGLALLLAPETQPHPFKGLEIIGKVFYVFDLAIFSTFVVAMGYRFVRWPKTLRRSITHPKESLFIAAMFLALASIIASTARYGIPSCGPWLVVVYRVLFWIYFAVTFCMAVVFYLFLFISADLHVEDMTPAWDLPIFPFMLSGTLASTGAGLQPRSQAIAMIVAGTTAQGLGFFISIIMATLYIRRMIEYGLPNTSSRPSMFIAVGPPAFTSLAIIGMANAFPLDFEVFGPAQTSIQVMKIVAVVTSIFMWSLSFWFFCIAVLACLLVARKMQFALNWWAFVFPNVGFTISTITIGKELQSQGIMWVGSIATIFIVILYLFIAVMHVRAVLTRQILYKGRDEDVYKEEARHKKKITKFKTNGEEQC